MVVCLLVLEIADWPVNLAVGGLCCVVLPVLGMGLLTWLLGWNQQPPND